MWTEEYLARLFTSWSQVTASHVASVRNFPKGFMNITTVFDNKQTNTTSTQFVYISGIREHANI
jgi:hypothetical protein